jgi:hypothetical protein
MGLAAASVFPVTAATKLVQIPGNGLIKPFEKVTPNSVKTATKLIGGAAVSSGVDSSQASDEVPKLTQQQQMLLDQLALPKQALARGESSGLASKYSNILEGLK